MSSVLTLANIRASVLDRADMTDSSFPVTARVTEVINNALGELYDIITTCFETYHYKTGDISVVSGTQSYSLPTDLYKIIRVYFKDSAGHLERPLIECDLDNLCLQSTDSLATTAEVKNLRYKIAGDKIWFSPMPSGSGTVQIWYVPEFTKLSAESDTMPFKMPVHWEEFIYVAAAIPLLDREESDSGALRATKAELEGKIRAAVQVRNVSGPFRIKKRRGRRVGLQWPHAR